MQPQSGSGDLDWYRATTLEERIASAHRGAGSEVRTDHEDRASSRRRETPTHGSPSAHARRLAADRLTEEEFQQFLLEPIERVRGRLPNLPWLPDLARAFSHPSFAEPLPLTDSQAAHPMAGVLNPLQPLLVQGLHDLREGIAALVRSHAELPFDPATIEQILFAPLTNDLLRMMSRTIALEVNVMRVRGRLTAATAQDRFREFTDSLGQLERALALWQEYPVLARQASIRIRQWVEANLELLGRLCADWTDLRRTFSPASDPGRLTALGGESGDRHQGGRAVRILEFASGLKIVYKPKAMALAVHFQALLDWINARSGGPAFRTIVIRDRGSYGWTEYVEAGPCTTREELARFHQRQGGYLALLYAIEAADFHLENIIAAGEHPVLIDLEALFHPRATEQIEFDDEAALRESESVIHVGLLPFLMFGDDETAGVDLSGWGGAPGQTTPFPVPVWEGTATDEMRIERRRVSLGGAKNRPLLAGAEVELWDFIDEILAGFTSVYRALLTNRVQLLAPDGPLAAFAGDDVRVILRPTRTYAVLLEESFHPDLLRDAVDRDLHFDRLWFFTDSSPGMARAVPAERRALNDGDIPFFLTHAGGVHLSSGQGSRVERFFAESGLAAACRKLRQLSPQDLERQTWIIRASVAARRQTARPRPLVPLPSATEAERPALEAAARAIGDRLDVLAIRDSRGANWLGIRGADPSGDVGALALDLYDGLPGIAVFLAYLASQTGDERYKDLSEASCATIERWLHHAGSRLTWIGGFTGWGGIIYAFTHLGALWGREALLDEAHGFAERLPALIDRDAQLDVTGGAAGCLGALLALHAQKPAAATLAAAVRCGDHLISKAQRDGEAACWPVPRLGALAGFGHGSGGIATMLLRLFAQTGEGRFRDTARAAINYEGRCFSAKAGNWRDLRDAGTESYPVAWCHGAAGVGLSRVAALPILGDDDIAADLEIALRTTAASFGNNHSLCHGDLGNLELLLQSGLEPWHTTALRTAGAILERARRDGWRCGTPEEVESPGLMTGLAGIGYGLLRLAAPAEVPSVLTLDAPAAAPQTVHSG